MGVYMIVGGIGASGLWSLRMWVQKVWMGMRATSVWMLLSP